MTIVDAGCRLARLTGNSAAFQLSRQFWYLWSGSFSSVPHDYRADPGMIED